jgi:hypothetical protein
MLKVNVASSFLAALMAALPAMAATVQVEFVKPESFTDVGRRHHFIDRDAALEAIRSHLVAQGAKKLPADESLAISITDVDLAGAFEPQQSLSREVRIVKDIYPPKIDLRFKLTRADGSVVKEGERTLRDFGFLTGTTPTYATDNFRYEKAMLDDWMEREFGDGPRAATR